MLCSKRKPGQPKRKFKIQLVVQHIGLSERIYDFCDNSKTKISYHPGYLLSSALVIIQSSELQLKLMYGKCEFYYWWKRNVITTSLSTGVHVI